VTQVAGGQSHPLNYCATSTDLTQSWAACLPVPSGPVPPPDLHPGLSCQAVPAEGLLRCRGPGSPRVSEKGAHTGEWHLCAIVLTAATWACPGSLATDACPGMTPVAVDHRCKEVACLIARMSSGTGSACLPTPSPSQQYESWWSVGHLVTPFLPWWLMRWLMPAPAGQHPGVVGPGHVTLPWISDLWEDHTRVPNPGEHWSAYVFLFLWRVLQPARQCP
jgi:hypothetical protein